jgi:predicted O-linked N-acetylglucosamine transferase (SPINDLY family)
MFYRTAAAFAEGRAALSSGLLKTVTQRVGDTNTTTQIVIAASFMKLNPAFLEACRAIVERSAGMAHLHLHTSGGSVLKLMHLFRNLGEILPTGRFTIHGFKPYADYLDMLNRMDMFLSPFPFGNTNGIVDALTVGLPGVCKTGPEVFERIDGALFARAWMPGWLVADTIDEYVDAAVRLATDHRERRSLRKYVIEANVVQRLFEGRPEAFADSLLALLREH